MTEPVRVEKSGPVPTVIIDRPQARNAVDRPTAEALYQAFDEFDHDESASVAVLYGANGTFCAGADLKGVFESSGGEPGPSDPMGKFLDLVGGMMDRLRVCPKPTISRAERPDDGRRTGAGHGLRLDRCRRKRLILPARSQSRRDARRRRHPYRR